MIDIRPCPCCGHRAELRELRTDCGGWYTIECLGCGLMIDGGDKQEIIDAWTRRRTDGMIRWLDAEIEKCEHATYVDAIRAGKYNALRDCKKQLLKLLDGMGVEESFRNQLSDQVKPGRKKNEDQ